MTVKNDAGQIALKRLRTNPKLVQLGTDTFYQFSPRYNICLAWVDPEDVDRILSMKRDCCGSGGKRQFWLASESDVFRYNTGRRL